MLEAGKSYRAKTVLGTQISFTVMDARDGVWVEAEVDDGGALEPRVWLNTGLLLWISSDQERSVAIAKAADEVIEALEGSVEAP